MTAFEIISFNFAVLEAICKDCQQKSGGEDYRCKNCIIFDCLKKNKNYLTKGESGK